MTSADAKQNSGHSRATWLIVMMGVSGSGKTTIGSLLAKRLPGASFLDADDYHPQANKDKMHAGHPLTDEDRWPWLATLNGLLRERSARGESCVLACSALKSTYRDKLQEGIPPGDVCFVLLEGSHELIAGRLAARHHEFMSTQLLESQFATLQTPSGAIKVCNDRSPDEVVDEIVQKCGLVPSPSTAGSSH